MMEARTSFTYGNRNALDVAVIEVRGEEALGFSQLKFHLELRTRSTDIPHAYLRDLCADVSFRTLGNHNIHVGRAVWHGMPILHQLIDHDRLRGWLALKVTPATVAALEARRREGVRFELYFRACFGHGGNLAWCPSTLTYDVPHGRWITVLHELGHGHSLLLETRLPQDSQWAGAVTGLREAHDHLRAGRSLDAVVAARRALEAVKIEGKLRSTFLDAVKVGANAVRDLEVNQRWGAAVYPLLQLTNPAAHGDGRDQYGQLEAEAIVAATAAVFRVLSQAPA